MNQAFSYFMPDKALFGCYPSSANVTELHSVGVRHFVDLTSPGDIPPTDTYSHPGHIRYPIPDMGVPRDIPDFSRFILSLGDLLRESSHKLYVHCRGGHGRAGLVVACLLCLMEKVNPATAISLTTLYHNKRKQMRRKWRQLGSPQTKRQRSMVFTMFKPMYFFNSTISHYYPTEGFCSVSPHHVRTELGLFANAELALQAFRVRASPDAVELLRRSRGEKVDARLLPVTPEWETQREMYMQRILLCKLDQHPDIEASLMNTGLRPLILCDTHDTFWGQGTNACPGKNVFGKILSNLRESKYRVNI